MCQYVGERETKEKIVVTFSCNPRHPSLSLSFSFSLSSSRQGSVHNYRTRTHTQTFLLGFHIPNALQHLSWFANATPSHSHENPLESCLFSSSWSCRIDIDIAWFSTYTKTRKLCNELIVFQYRYSLNISTMF